MSKKKKQFNQKRTFKEPRTLKEFMHDELASCNSFESFVSKHYELMSHAKRGSEYLDLFDVINQFQIENKFDVAALQVLKEHTMLEKLWWTGKGDLK